MIWNQSLFTFNHFCLCLHWFPCSSVRPAHPGVSPLPLFTLPLHKTLHPSPFSSTYHNLSSGLYISFLNYYKSCLNGASTSRLSLSKPFWRFQVNFRTAPFRKEWTKRLTNQLCVSSPKADPWMPGWKALVSGPSALVKLMPFRLVVRFHISALLLWGTFEMSRDIWWRRELLSSRV